MKIFLTGLVLAAAVLMTGCTAMAPGYSPGIPNIQAAKQNVNGKVAVGTVTSGNKKVESVSLRGTSLKSPQGSYSAYLQQALSKVLSDAGVLDKSADKTISAVLTRNEMDAAISTGTGDITALFQVKQAERVLFNKEVIAHHEWDSSFMGAVAIPNAVNSYPELVDKLILNLLKDPDFIAVLRN